MAFGHLQHLQSLLTGVSSAVEVAERKARACHLALAEAQAASTTANQEWHTLLQSQAGLQQAIAEARRAVRYTLLLPNEIMSLVFAHATTWDSHDSSTPIDWAAAKLPGRLRLVCKRWDAVALSTHALWTYLAIPATLEFIDRTELPESIALQLERSGSLPLKVVIDAEFTCDMDTMDRGRDLLIGNQSEALRNIFDVLVTQPTVARISILEVYGGPPTPGNRNAYQNDRDNIRDLTLGMLRLPTPTLEEVRLELDPDEYDEHEPWRTSPEGFLPQYLPVAPKLRILHMVHFPLLCHPPHPGFPSLEVLSYLYNFVNGSHLLGMLSLCPALRELVSSIDFVDSLSPAIVTDLITLPVQSLDLSGGESSAFFVEGLRLPNVTTLRVPPHLMLSHNLHQTLASTLTSVTFCDFSISADDIDRIVVLTRIEEATFETRHFPARRLVECLCRDEPFWPRLRHLIIDTFLTTDEGDALVQLARHTKARESVGAPRLESLTVRKAEVANWVLAQLRSSLGADNVHTI